MSAAAAAASKSTPFTLADALKIPSFMKNDHETAFPSSKSYENCIRKGYRLEANFGAVISPVAVTKLLFIDF